MGRSLNIDNFKEILLAERRKNGDAPTLRLRHQCGNWRSLMGSQFGFLVRGLARNRRSFVSPTSWGVVAVLDGLARTWP